MDNATGIKIIKKTKKTTSNFGITGQDSFSIELYLIDLELCKNVILFIITIDRRIVMLDHLHWNINFITS